jgi:hypothetical protein
LLQEGQLVIAQDQTGGSHLDSIKGTARLALWTLAWVATLALARFGPGSLWDSQPVPGWAAIAGNIAVGIGLIIAHARYLQDLDELQRKIMLDAMAVTLGAGLVAGCAYGAAANADLIARDAEIGLLLILMAVVYVIASVGGNMRYR